MLQRADGRHQPTTQFRALTRLNSNNTKITTHIRVLRRKTKQEINYIKTSVIFIIQMKNKILSVKYKNEYVFIKQG